MFKFVQGDKRRNEILDILTYAEYLRNNYACLLDNRLILFYYCDLVK